MPRHLKCDANDAILHMGPCECLESAEKSKKNLENFSLFFI